jgi:hypothetical protein
VTVIDASPEAAVWVAALVRGPARGCEACPFPTTWHHPTYGAMHPRCAPYVCAHHDWLSVLAAGPLGGCVACRASSVWHHPVHGPVHRSCVHRAKVLLGVGEGDDIAEVAVPRGRRGAYDRRR